MGSVGVHPTCKRGKKNRWAHQPYLTKKCRHLTYKPSPLLDPKKFVSDVWKDRKITYSFFNDDFYIIFKDQGIKQSTARLRAKFKFSLST